MTQRWHDLLFAHWRVPVGTLRAHVPAELEIEAFDGSAWIGIVPFRMSGIRLRGLPAVPGTSAFPELNVRTYVRHGGKAGVWFFSLDATNALAVAAARKWFHLPYFRARMACRNEEERVSYVHERTHAGAPPAELVAQYSPTSPVELARSGTLEHWLTERYCLYAVGAGGRITRGDIHHLPWPLQRADARLERCTMAAQIGIDRLEGAPHLLFARQLKVLVWAPRPAHQDRRPGTATA